MTGSARFSAAQHWQCRVELAWQDGRGLWWNPHHRGTSAQLSATLTELATRIRNDTSAQRTLRAAPDARIHYTLVVVAEGRVLVHHDLTLELLDLPAQLRADAADLRHRRAPCPPAG